MFFWFNQRFRFLKSLLDFKVDSRKKTKFINLQFLHQWLHFDLISQSINLISDSFDKPILILFSVKLQWKLNSSFRFDLMGMKHTDPSNYWRWKLFTQNVSHYRLRRHIKNSSLLIHLLPFIDWNGFRCNILNHNLKLQLMNIKKFNLTQIIDQDDVGRWLLLCLFLDFLMVLLKHECK